MTDLERITYKDIMTLTNSKESFAKKLLADIKAEFELKVVCFCHFKKYLKV